MTLCEVSGAFVWFRGCRSSKLSTEFSTIVLSIVSLLSSIKFSIGALEQECTTERTAVPEGTTRTGSRIKYRPPPDAGQPTEERDSNMFAKLQF